MTEAQMGSDWPRVLAEVRGAAPGPTLVVVVGLHGNEPEAAIAGREFAQELRARPIERGRVVVLVGNRRALAEDLRYVDRDLNRLWTASHVRRLEGGIPSVHGAHEDREQLDLKREIDRALDGTGGMGHALIDLHCYSGQGRPFVIGTDRTDNVEFAQALGMPLVLGLQESLGGTLSDYYDRRSGITLAVEGGRIGDADAVRAHREILHRSLITLGLVGRDHFGPRVDSPIGRVRVFRVIYRHPIEPDDGFEMVEGFAGFESVQRGELLARDRAGEIRAPHDGVMLMPLYQPVGTDGFFLATEVDLELA